MEVTFTLTENDAWEFSKHLVRSRSNLLVKSVLRIIFPIATWTLAAVFITWLLHDQMSLTSWGVLLVLTGLWVWYVFWNWKRRVVLGAKNSPGWVGTHFARIGTEGFFGTSAIDESLLKWRAFTEMQRTPRYFCLFLSSTNAVIIPLAAFPSPSIADEFYAQAYAYWQESKLNLSPAPNTNPGVWPPAPQLRPSDKP